VFQICIDQLLHQQLVASVPQSNRLTKSPHIPWGGGLLAFALGVLSAAGAKANKPPGQARWGSFLAASNDDRFKLRSFDLRNSAFLGPPLAEREGYFLWVATSISQQNSPFDL
jgi:hypothetical protein